MNAPPCIDNYMLQNSPHNISKLRNYWDFSKINKNKVKQNVKRYFSEFFGLFCDFLSEICVLAKEDAAKSEQWT